MILDQLKSANTYSGLGELFDEAFSYLQTFDPTTQDGRYDIKGSRLYALVQTFETAPPSERTFESHRAYADIHFILSGNEIIYYCESSLLTPKDEGYDAERDVTFYQDRDARPIYLATGEFAVFWPQDGHKPGCLADVPVATRKVVVKIRLTD